MKNEDTTKIAEEITRLSDLVGTSHTIIELTVQDESAHPNIAKINKHLEKLATQLELPLTCANNYHYIDEADQKVSEVALAIKDGKRMFDDDRRKVSLQQHIMSEQEIRDILTDNGYDTDRIQQMIQSTADIADMIDLDIPLNKILFPKYESPDQIKELYEKHKDGLVVG